MSKSFNQRFRLEVSDEESIRRFVNRLHNEIWNDYCDDLTATPDGSLDARKAIVHKLGDKWYPESISNQVGENFYRNLMAIETLWSVLPGNEERKSLGKRVRSVIDLSEADLGIRWKNGRFYKAGAPALDEALVNDPLGLLKAPGLEGVSTPFQKGLDHYLNSSSKPKLLTDVLTDMHEALEALAKIICNNDHDLSSNREEFISGLKLADSYKRMLKEYIKYANDFARHAGPDGKQKPLPSRREVEGFMYLTGLFIRLALSKEI